MSTTNRIHAIVAPLTLYAYCSSLLLACGAENSRTQEISTPEGPVETQREALSPPVFHPASPVDATGVLRPEQGTFTVTPQGEAVWALSLRIPPGVNGVQPSLGVEYRSRGAQGALGQGFALTGLQAITKCWSDAAHGSPMRNSTLARDFCLDGKRLIRRSGVGSNGTYSPEFDPGTMIKPVGGTPDDPDYFVVYTKNGRSSYFGLRDNARDNSNSRVRGTTTAVAAPSSPLVPHLLTTGDVAESVGPTTTFSWNVDLVADEFGNAYSVDYTREIDSANHNAIQVLPSRIAWVGGTRTVEFEWNNARLDPAIYYREGLAVKYSKLLSKVRIGGPDGLTEQQQSGTQAVEYTFRYDATGNGAQRRLDRLIEIHECLGHMPGTLSCLDPIAFSWLGRSNGLVPDFGPIQTDSSQTDILKNSGGDYELPAVDVLDMVTGDFNRDGYADVLVKLPTLDSSHSFVPHGNGGLLAEGRWFTRLGSPTGLGKLSPATGLPFSYGGDGRFTLSVVDLDNDGASDVFAYSQTETGAALQESSYRAYFATCTPQACSFAENMAYRLGLSSPIENETKRQFGVLLGDVNGDGRTDVLVDGRSIQSSLPTGISSVLVGTSTGVGLASPFLPLQETVSPSGGPVSIVNVDVEAGGFRALVDTHGNGRVQLLSRRGYDPDPLDIAGPHTFTIFHFDQTTSTGISTNPSQSTLFATDLNVLQPVNPTSAWICPGFNPTSWTHIFLDVNGDGLRDVVSVPDRSFDVCPSITSSAGFTLLSMNYGGAFGAARPAGPSGDFWFPAAQRINPTVYALPTLGVRGIDNGARVVDLDRDGRDDIVLVSQGLSNRERNGSLSASRQNMVWLRSTGSGYVQFELGVPAVRNFYTDFWGREGGFGPRLVRFADVNGDGLADIVMAASTPNGQAIGVRFQMRQEPDVISGITAGPHSRRVDIEYELSSPHSSAYSPGICAWPQVCEKSIGWVVSRHAVESLGFDARQPSCLGVLGKPENCILFEHKYGDGRRDTMGWGNLGVGRYSRVEKDSSGTVFEMVTKTFDVETAVCVDGQVATAATCASKGRYVYLQTATPQSVSTEVKLEDGTIRTASASYRRDVGLGAFLSFQVKRDVDVSTVSELRPGLGATKQVLSSTRTRRVFDSYGSSVDVRSESWLAGPEPDLTFDPQTDPAGLSMATVRVVAVGTNQVETGLSAGDAQWLVNRYPNFEISRTDPLVTPPSLTTHQSVEYDPHRTTISAITIEPGRQPPETPCSGALSGCVSGYELRTQFFRNANGTVYQVERTGSSQSRSVSFGYDSDGLYVTTRTTQAGPNSPHLQEKSYYERTWGLLAAADDVAEVRTEYQYDALGRLRGVIPAAGNTVTVSYSELGGAQPQMFPNRNWSRCETSEASGMHCAVVNPRGLVVGTSETAFDQVVSRYSEYDLRGRLVTRSLPFKGRPVDALVKTWAYDNLGRLKRATRPGESKSAPSFSTTYDYLGRTTTVTDERAQVSAAELDSRGRVIRTTAVESPTHAVSTLRTYWHYDLLKDVTHPRLPTSQAMSPSPGDLVTTITYDLLGRRESVVDPDAGESTTRYNAFGEVKANQDALGAVTLYEHDGLGRTTLESTLATQDYAPPNTALRPSYARFNRLIYDGSRNGRGKLTSANSNDGVRLRWDFDDFGRVSTSSTTTPGGAKLSFGMSYNASSQLKGIVYPQAGGSGLEIDYEYAGNGAVRTIWNASDPTKPTKVWEQISKNEASESTEEHFGSTIQTTRQYDKSFALRFQETDILPGTPVQRISYAWGGNGLLERRTDLDLGSVEHYEPDFMGRLKDWRVDQGSCGGGVDWRFGYDDSGDVRARTLVQGPPSFASLTYAYTTSTPVNVAQPHAVKRIHSSSSTGSKDDDFSYDAAGHMIRGDGKQFGWTPWGLPRHVDAKPQSSDYIYDALGRRTVEMRSSVGATSQVVTVGGLFEMRALTSPSVKTEYVYSVLGPTGVVAQISRTSGVSQSDQIHFVHPDYLGNPDAVTSESQAGGAVVGRLDERARFEPFGEKRYPWMIAQPLARPYSADATLGYTGHHPDAGFGLIDMGGRIYNPHIARFLTPDPLASPTSQELNRYSYVGNSPTAFVDPSGFEGEGLGVEKLGDPPSAPHDDGPSIGSEVWDAIAGPCRGASCSEPNTTTSVQNFTSGEQAEERPDSVWGGGASGMSGLTELPNGSGAAPAANSDFGGDLTRNEVDAEALLEMGTFFVGVLYGVLRANIPFLPVPNPENHVLQQAIGVGQGVWGIVQIGEGIDLMVEGGVVEGGGLVGAPFTWGASEVVATLIAVPAEAVGAVEVVQGVNNVATGVSLYLQNSREGETGSYTVKLKSGKEYHGKGPEKRAEVSAKREAKASKEEVEWIEWERAQSEREAFKAEARRIRAAGGVGEESGNLNRINSPGEKYLQEDEGIGDQSDE